MFGLPIRSVMEPRKLVVASPQTSVREAARLMMDARVGAVLVGRQRPSAPPPRSGGYATLTADHAAATLAYSVLPVP